MQLFSYNQSDSKIHFGSEAAILRLACLIADTAGATESTGFFIHSEEAYEGCSLKTQIKIMAHFMEQDDPRNLALLQQVAQQVSTLSKVRHKSGKDLVMIRKTEQVVAGYFSVYIKKVTDFMNNVGLGGLAALEADDTLVYIPLNNPDPELESTNAEGYHVLSASRILRLDIDWEEDEAHDMTLVLPLEFFDPEFGPSVICSASDPAAAQDASIWMEPLFGLPFLHFLKVPELQILRQQLRQPGQAFRNAFDTWLADAREQQRSAGERIQYFEQAVRPAAAALGAAVGHNHLLSSLLRIGGEPVYEVCAGELPLQAAWDFYQKTNTLHESTQRALAAAASAGALRVPVIALRPTPALDMSLFKSSIGDSIANSPEEGASVRKTIRLD